MFIVRRVCVMEFCEGMKVTDAKSLSKVWAVWCRVPCECLGAERAEEEGHAPLRRPRHIFSHQKCLLALILKAFVIQHTSRLRKICKGQKGHHC